MTESIALVCWGAVVCASVLDMKPVEVQVCSIGSGYQIVSIAMLVLIALCVGFVQVGSFVVGPSKLGRLGGSH